MDLVAPLGKAGVECVAIARKGDPTRYSRYVNKSLDTVDVWNEPESMVERLLTAAAAEEQKPVLFYQTDPDLVMVSRFRDELSEGFLLDVAAPKLVEELVDKAAFHDLAERHDLPVPKTVLLNPGDPVAKAEALPLPVIMKPALRKPEGWVPVANTAKAVEADTVEELRSLWSTFDESGVAVIVQEMLMGPESDIESHHVYIDSAGEFAGEFTGRKIRTKPLKFGISTSVEVVDIPAIRRLGRDICERVGLTGVAKLDFKRNHYGHPILLEINARYTLWHNPGAVAGVNIPGMVYADLTGTPRPAVTPVTKPVRWVKPWFDISAAKEDGLSMASWMKFVATCQTKSAVSWRDPKGAAAAAKFGVNQRLGKF